MRIAIISDVHADVHALRDALAQIERLACDHVVCAGDLIDWGLFPEETIAVLRERGMPCVRGNHDRWAVKDGHDTSGWDLTGSAISFLEHLGTQWTATIEGVRVVVAHARPGNDMQGIYPDATAKELRMLVEAAGADVLIVGHTHVPMNLVLPGGELVGNPGALLRDPAHPMEDGAMLYDPDQKKFVPAPKPGGGTFGVLDLPSRNFRVFSATDGMEIASIVRKRVS